MHAANLLNKRRQREEQLKAAVSTPPEVHRDSSHRHPVSRKTASQTSFLDSIGAGACSTPTSSIIPRIPSTVAEIETSRSRSQGQHVHHQSQFHRHHQHQGSSHWGGQDGRTGGPQFSSDPLILYHKPERISCAHIGLCVMIVGTIVTIIAGFIGYLLGFGEPGVIIGCGGGIITVVGLILLCCGNRWHLDERTLRKKIPLIDSLQFNSLRRSDEDEEDGGSLRRTGRVGDKLDVSKLVKMVSETECDDFGEAGKSNLPASSAKSKGLSALEIDMITEPEPSGYVVHTFAEEIK